MAFEKNHPNLIGGRPPVHFVKYPPKKPTDKKLFFVKIAFSKSATKNSEIFITGNMNKVMVHETILTDLDLEDQVKATRAVSSTKKKSLADLRKPQAQASTAYKNSLVEAIKEPDGSLVSLQAEAFDHVKKLLCPTLQLQLKDIAK